MSNSEERYLNGNDFVASLGGLGKVYTITNKPKKKKVKSKPVEVQTEQSTADHTMTPISNGLGNMTISEPNSTRSVNDEEKMPATTNQFDSNVVHQSSEAIASKKPIASKKINSEEKSSFDSVQNSSVTGTLISHSEPSISFALA